MSYWQHHRTYDHRGTEDCDTVVLSAAVGRYPAGNLLCEVLEDLQRRLALISADYVHGFATATFDAFIAPYSPGTLGGSLLGVFGFDAMIAVVPADSFGIDAVITSPGEQTATFGLKAYINDVGGGAVAQLATDADATQTTITVTSAAGFPTSGDYLIQIGAEIMLVTGGHGTTTWTVTRGYNGTTATVHSAGAVLADC